MNKGKTKKTMILEIPRKRPTSEDWKQVWPR